MKLLEKNCRIALVQGTPVLFDRIGTVEIQTSDAAQA